MRVGIGMASGTVGGGVAESLVAVALLAWHRDMQTNQREAAQIVVEKDFGGPAGFIVAALAVAT